MKTFALSEDEAYEVLDEAYNPPVFTETYTEQEFSEEWHGTRRKLDAMLSQFGKNDAYGEGDYNLGETLALSRGIGLEITSSSLLNKRLIPKVQELLVTLDKEYEIDFAIFTDEGVSHVFVTRDRVRYWCPKIIKRSLGI
jgi:hypothetical protein